MDGNDKDNGNYVKPATNHRWHTVQIVREGRIVEAKVEPD